jgi:hypothetical protein
VSVNIKYPREIDLKNIQIIPTWIITNQNLSREENREKKERRERALEKKLKENEK